MLVSSLYKQLLDLTSKTKENPALPLMEKFSAEREGLLLRLSLVGGIFKQICQPQHSEGWSHLFFQMMLYGMVSPDKDRILYDSCYDMLSTLMLWTLTAPSTATQQISEGSEPKFRWPYYSIIIKRLKKEIADQRIPSELRALLQFLPIPKNTISVFVTEPYGSPTSANVQKITGGATRTPSLPSSVLLSGLRHGRYALQVVEKVKTSSYDFIHAYINEQNSKGGWKWSWFQASKLDRLPCPIQRWVAKLLVHKHQLEYHRPNAVITESSDHFLSAPAVEATGEAPPPSSVSSVNTPGTQTPATPTTSAGPPEAVTPGNDETITSRNSAVSTPTANDPPADEVTPEQNRGLTSVPNSIVSPRTGARGGRKRGNVNRPHPGVRQKRSASRNEPPGPSVATSFNQPWHSSGCGAISNVSSQAEPTTYSQQQSQQVSSNAVKDPTKTKIQECINKKRLEAARNSAAIFPSTTSAQPSAKGSNTTQISFSDSSLPINQATTDLFQETINRCKVDLLKTMVLICRRCLQQMQASQQHMQHSHQHHSAQQPPSTAQHSMQTQVIHHVHHMQQMPSQPGMQPSLVSQQAMQMQAMQNQQISQQSVMQQHMSQSHVHQQTRTINPQGGQQFAQGGGSSQNPVGVVGSMQIGYQGQAHACVSQQQPRNPMGQFTSRDGAVNIDYQQGSRGARQPIHMGQHSQATMARSGQKGNQLMGSLVVSGEQQMETQQMADHSMGSQQIPHHMGQVSLTGQQYYMQQDQRAINQSFIQSQYSSNDQF
ncbi:hypothetical protein KIN20_011149 [Parelaphostrongylus tenuis]|uniref:C2H2-type domain-containing protein n=1 Tax=Parelaphostrongylus tenuis TaxID=148309 RepID=A0AAD5M8Z2_PARTN|nr:hypothetical protein KIN20_011149 [Parelaphostrongylus tenuis]